MVTKMVRKPKTMICDECKFQFGKDVDRTKVWKEVQMTPQGNGWFKCPACGSVATWG